jgi:hypothetical protein
VLIIVGSTSPVGLLLLLAFGYMGFCTAFYLSKYVPLAIAKYAGVRTQTGVLIPYPGVSKRNPNSERHNPTGRLVRLLCGACPSDS